MAQNIHHPLDRSASIDVMSITYLMIGTSYSAPCRFDSISIRKEKEKVFK